MKFALNKNSTSVSQRATSNPDCSAKTDLDAIIKIGIEGHLPARIYISFSQIGRTLQHPNRPFGLLFFFFFGDKYLFVPNGLLIASSTVRIENDMGST